MKKYRISVKEQQFDFYDFASAKAKAIEMITNGCWFLTLEEIDTEKDKQAKKKKKKKK